MWSETREKWAHIQTVHAVYTYGIKRCLIVRKNRNKMVNKHTLKRFVIKFRAVFSLLWYLFRSFICFLHRHLVKVLWTFYFSVVFHSVWTIVYSNYHQTMILSVDNICSNSVWLLTREEMLPPPSDIDIVCFFYQPLRWDINEKSCFYFNFFSSRSLSVLLFLLLSSSVTSTTLPSIHVHHPQLFVNVM